MSNVPKNPPKTTPEHRSKITQIQPKKIPDPKNPTKHPALFPYNTVQFFGQGVDQGLGE